MNDLFPDTCPHCGQAMPSAEPADFDAFWEMVPHKIGKDPAKKAWRKLTATERKSAADGVQRFYRWFAKAYPSASALHPATYLNNRRWLDEGAQPLETVPRAHRLALVAKNIKSGKRFLCTQISAAQARECIAMQLVTEAQCREVGVL